MKLPGISASFGPPRVFYFPGTQRICSAFPYPPPGEAPDGRLATSQGIGLNLKMNMLDTSYFAMPGNNSKLKKKKELENILKRKTSFLI